jgi:hypothetical protein
MQPKPKRLVKVSLIFTLLTFFISGVLFYSSPACGGPGISGVQSSVSDENAGGSNSASEAVEDDADGDVDLGEDISNDGALMPRLPLPNVGRNQGPLLMSLGEINSMTEEAIPFRKATGFDVFNAQYQNQWKASFSKKTGKVKLLYDFRSRRYPGDPENVAREFLKESGALFGMNQDLSDLKVIRVNRTAARVHVKLQQTYNDIPIAGVFVLVHSNRWNRVTMVQNNYIEGFQPSNQEQLSAESAMEIARNDLRAGLGNSATFSEAKAEKLIAPHQGAYYYVWSAMISTRSPLGLWVYRVDASTGQILHKSNRIRSLNGVGRVYKSNAAYLSGTTTDEALDKLLPSSSTNYTGYLFGSHAAIHNYNPLDAGALPPYVNTFIYDGDDPFANNLRFLYDPGTNHDWFDAVNAYYKLNVIWNWWNLTVVPKYVNNKTYPNYRSYVPRYTDNYPIPVIVNEVDNGACNAFYHPDIHGNLSFLPGFVFGDQNTCSFSNEDFVLDEDIVAHEFAHFMVDQCGFTDAGEQFDDTLYGLSMDEGNADFFAFLRTKNTYMGNVAFASSPLGYLRNLDNTRIYPDDVDDPSLGGPEPHYTGEIWGGYLYDLYKLLGVDTLKYVFPGFYYFQGGGFAGAARAQYLAEKDVSASVPLSRKAAGAAASRGLSVAVRPCYPADGPVGNYWVFPPTTSISSRGILHNAGDLHEYLVEATKPVMDLTVTVSSAGLAAPTITEPIISVYYISSPIVIDPYNINCASVTHLTTVGPRSSTTTQLSWPGLGAGLYSIVVTGTGTGNYTFSVMLQ